MRSLSQPGELGSGCLIESDVKAAVRVGHDVRVHESARHVHVLPGSYPTGWAGMAVSVAWHPTICSRMAVSDAGGSTICALMARSRILVGRRGLEPRTSAVTGLERCAYDLAEVNVD